MILTPDTRELARSLASRVCPACGRGKKPRQTFCIKCYYFLSRDDRASLYARVGEGYENAVTRAMKLLGKTQFILPVQNPQSAI
jgi:hypothetical protein